MKDKLECFGEAVLIGLGFSVGAVIIYVLCKCVGIIDTLVHAI
jgi:hypothetical protein